MTTLFKYTNSSMSGWQFIRLTDNGTDGYFTTGNTASTSQNTSSYDMSVEVKTKKELKAIVNHLDWLAKYSNLGKK